VEVYSSVIIFQTNAALVMITTATPSLYVNDSKLATEGLITSIRLLKTK
jgi:hypothetical protein